MSEVVLPEDTFACTAPKRTILLAAIALKLAPVIVTLVPTGPDVGANEVIVGCAKRSCTNKDKRIKKMGLFTEGMIDLMFAGFRVIFIIKESIKITN